jgi:flagellar basal body-associated protein FliL
MGRASFICSITGFVFVFVFWLVEFFYIVDFNYKYIEIIEVILVVNLIFIVLSFILSIIFGIIGIKKNDVRKETAKTGIIYSSVGMVSIIIVFLFLLILGNYERKKWKDYEPVASGEYTAALYDKFGAIITKTNEDFVVNAEVILSYDLYDLYTINELKLKHYEIKEQIKEYFSTKSIVDLFPTNERAIKEEIREIINNLLIKGKIYYVYFNRLDVTKKED